MNAGIPIEDDVSRPFPARSLIGTPVRVGDIAVGRVSDVVFDRDLARVVGLVVSTRGDRHFLPWISVTREPGHVAAGSVFAMLSTSELAFYLEHGIKLTDELGLGSPGSVPADVLVRGDGMVVSLVHGESRALAPHGGPA